MNSQLILRQHILVKIAIFLTVLIGGFEMSLKQLGLQALLFFLYMLFHPKLFGYFFFAVRKLLSFFAAYWVLAMLFKAEFPEAAMLSLKILYFLLITVAIWGAVDRPLLLSELSPLFRFKSCKPFFFYSFATYFFIKEYLKEYQALPKNEELASIIGKVVESGRRVFESSEAIESKVNGILGRAYSKERSAKKANIFGLAFLFAISLGHNI